MAVIHTLGPFDKAGSHLIEIQPSSPVGGTTLVSVVDYGSGTGLETRVHLPPGYGPFARIWLVEYAFASQNEADDHMAVGNPLLLVDCPDLPLSVDGTPYDPALAAMVLFNNELGARLIRLCPHLPLPFAHDHGHHGDCLVAFHPPGHPTGYEIKGG
jgi:hypothetical protein